MVHILRKKNYTIYANDIQYYSYVLIKHFIENNVDLSFESLFPVIPELQDFDTENRPEAICRFLESLEPKEGFIYNTYCQGGTENKEFQRLYFTDENGKQCDSIRQKIENWYNSQ